MFLFFGVFVFVAIFALVAILLSGIGTNPAKQFQKTLDSALTVADTPARNPVADVRKKTTFSTIPWLDQFLGGMDPAVKLRRLLEQADLKWTPNVLVLGAVTAWALSAYLISLKGIPGFFCALIALPVGLAPFMYVLKQRNTRFFNFRKKLPETIDLMVSALRAGYSMAAAFAHCAKEAPDPIKREFTICAEEQNLGVDLRTAMVHLTERVPVQELRIISTAILINRDSGGNLAEVLDKTAAVIRQRFRIQQQIKVLTAQGRLTGNILTLLPLALGIILYTINPEYIRLLWTDALGRRILILSIAMDLAGAAIIRKIVNIRL
jgi:tight adherence protein B